MFPGKLKNYLAGYLPLNLIQAGASLAVVMVYTRLLAPEHYGRYAIALVAIQWSQSLVFYWLHGGVARFYAMRRERDQLPALLTTAGGVALGLSASVAVVGGLAATLATGPWRWLIIAGVVALITRSLLLIGLEAHRAARAVTRYSALEGTHCVLALAVGAWFALATDGAAAAAVWGTAAASIVVLALELPRWRHCLHPRAWSNDELRRLARYGLPLAAAALLSQIIASSDRFFIAWLIDDQAVGRYSVAYALADRPSALVFIWVAMAALPLAYVAMEREGPAAARLVMEKTATSLILLMLPCTAGLAAIATPLAAVVVGAEFREDTAHLIPGIAVASLLYGAMTHYSTHAFLITQKTRLLLFANLGVALLYSALNALLIPRFGLDGAVGASIVAYALGLLSQLLLAHRFFPVPIMGSQLLRALVACAAMVAAIKAAALPMTLGGLTLSILLGIVAYSASAVVFNVADSRAWLIARWRRRYHQGPAG